MAARRRKRRTAKKGKTLDQRVTALEKAIQPIAIAKPRGGRKQPMVVIPTSRAVTPPHIRRQLGLPY